MKTDIVKKAGLLIIIFYLILINIADAQTNWQVGGNTFTGTPTYRRVGSINNYELRIMANDTNRLSFLPAALSSTGKSITKFYNTDSIVFNVGTTNFPNHVRMGGGLIGSEGGTMSFSRAASSLSDAFKMKSFPLLNASVLLVDVLSTGIFNCYGIKVHANPAPGFGVGVQALGGKWGLNGIARGGSYTGQIIIGVRGYAEGNLVAGSTRAGVYGTADTSAIGYGIFGEAGNGNTISRAGFFSGDLEYTGTLIGPPSDERLKENISPVPSVLEKLKMLNTISYTYKEEYSFMHLGKGKQTGLLAQDLEKAFPELVKESAHPAVYTDDGEKIHDEVRFKNLNYMGLVPILVKGNNEQQQLIENLNKEVADLKNQVAEMQSSLRKLANNGAENSVNGKTVLEQNTPNPFTEKTVIKYFIAEGNENTVINIYTSDRVLLKTFPVNSKGNGQMTIEAGTFAAGNYFYELMVDNQIVDSKQMSITK